MNRIAKSKVWASRDGRLVPDGSELASVLVARAGQRMPAEAVQHFENADDFFSEELSKPVRKKPGEEKRHKGKNE